MARPLNVLLIVVDGARADRLGCYGYTRETTPFIDRMAREGVRFGAAFATSTWTLPTHASLFTGLFATTHGATDEHPFLGPERATLAETLKRAGYRTSAFCSNPWVGPRTGLGRGFDSFHTPLGDGRSIARAVFYARRATDRILRRADAGARRTNLAFFEWLEAGEAPFFAFLHYGEPRLRRQPPVSYERMFLSPEVRRGEVKALEREWKRAGALHEEREEGRRQMLGDLYDGALRYVDSRLGEVGEHLASHGLWDDTLVVLCSDHGQDLGEHALAAPGFGLYDTILRVPLILRCPPSVPQGFVVDEFAQHVDVLPTVLHLLGVEPEPATHGRALLENGRATAGPAFAVAERFRPDLEALRKRAGDTDLRPFEVRARAVRTRREKFIWRSDEANEFYDLSADPGERHNRIDQAGARAAALRTSLFDWLASLERCEPEPPVAAEEGRRQQA